jgi:alcohol dehydrogenase class IV
VAAPAERQGDFLWRDAGRTVVFRRHGVDRAAAILAEHGFADFELLSTERGLGEAGELAAAATAVHEVPPGAVPDLSAALLGEVAAPRLVALGGGRTVDVAKAIAAVSGARVAAIPTTMSGAEMTGIHRLPAGAENRVAGMARPELVIADPLAMTGQPEPLLRASSMNALAHGVDSLYTPFANPVSRMAALRGAELIATALDQGREVRDATALALGSILCGYAIDSGGFGLHHVVCQTLVRVCGGTHAAANAAILPRAMAFLVTRAPEAMAEAASAIGTDPGGVEKRVLELGGKPPGLSAGGADREKLEQAIEAILRRPELAFVPGPTLTRGEIGELIETAW